MDDETGGRPRKYTGMNAPLHNFTSKLSIWHERAARRIGGGNASEGIRIAIERTASEDDMLIKPERAGND